jgi:exosortase J
MILTAVALFGLARSASGTTMTASTKRFPQRVGNYTLVRTWNETLVTGPVVYLWAQYAPAKGGTPIAVGVSPILGWHDPLLCHTVRGEHPVWQGPLLVTTGTTTPVSFSSALYDDGMTRSIEASTQCAHGECGESETNRTDFGFVYTPTSMLNQGDQQAIRVLVMAESQNETGPEDITRRELTEDVEKFLASVNLADLTLVDSR